MRIEIENKMVELGVLVVDPLADIDRQLDYEGPYHVYDLPAGARGFDISEPSKIYTERRGGVKFVRYFIGSSSEPAGAICARVVKSIQRRFAERQGDLYLLGFGYEFGYELAGYFIEPND